MNYALITGASKGIGKSIAIELAKRKYPVLLVARSENELELTAREIHEAYGVATDYLACDLSKENAAIEIFNWCAEKKYRVQVLVNNAGYGYAGKFENYNLEAYNEMMQVNMNALIGLCHVFIPTLKSFDESYILNIASSAAYQATPGLAVYSASKAFVLSFSRALHRELAHTNLSVSCVCPGGTDTNFASRAQVGNKALKLAARVNMTPAAVAKIAVHKMFKKQPEIITGTINKLGAFFAWLLPKKLVEKSAASIYEV
ncbi:MAG: SDR family oxidoreductase [Ferruginibacter sp.]